MVRGRILRAGGCAQPGRPNKSSVISRETGSTARQDGGNSLGGITGIKDMGLQHFRRDGGLAALWRFVRGIHDDLDSMQFRVDCRAYNDVKAKVE